jgi:hypothetical protein
METTFQTSFIPKQPVTEQKQSRASSSVNILLFISIIIFVISVIAAGLVYFYKSTLEKSVAASEEELARAKDAFDGNFITDLQTADKRLRAAGDVLGNHIILSPIFEILQSSTLKTVRFTKFTHTVVGTGAGARIEVKMSGRAKDYTAIALQSDALTRSKYIKDPLFSNLTLDDQSNVLFEVVFTVDPHLVLFTDVIAKGDSATGTSSQTQTQQQVDQLPASNQGATQ